MTRAHPVSMHCISYKNCVVKCNRTSPTHKLVIPLFYSLQGYSFCWNQAVGTSHIRDRRDSTRSTGCGVDRGRSPDRGSGTPSEKETIPLWGRGPDGQRNSERV